MIRRNGAEARKERMQQIAQYIQAKLHNVGEISLSKTVAELQYKFGLTEKKIMEYLETLEILGEFIIDKELDIIKRPTK
jgi:hypothetical protein